MATINTASTGHGNRFETYSGGLTIQFDTFPEATDDQRARLAKLTRAFRIVDRLDTRIGLDGPCNRHFQSLPRGRSFHEQWRSIHLFINYSPSTAFGFFGATHSNNLDICISAWALDNHNRWMIGATIVHELAHTAGAPGGTSHAAERAVHRCGFADQYDPAIIGSLEDISRYLQQVA